MMVGYINSVQSQRMRNGQKVMQLSIIMRCIILRTGHNLTAMREELEVMLNTLAQQTNNYMKYLQPYPLIVVTNFLLQNQTRGYSNSSQTLKIRTAVQQMA
jgi:hypothetical protein